jgi:hypothetical protein
VQVQENLQVAGSRGRIRDIRSKTGTDVVVRGIGDAAPVGSVVVEFIRSACTEDGDEQ